ncbi:nitrogenase component 1 [Methanobrevibacter curvatus]|uniref:Nitrogenase molybdenum-iron protein alpha chain n=1 Tax=Methanobrevibacter curvatus TaxID=49547 RepID=A0A165Z530_9EURY|nr:nitrogenase component 1 [Methanobrevibacter curvatus]KZX10256.1 nitrogenase molybdenum-iron protein alpha chain [Methanobrevibacter curvatus]
MANNNINPSDLDTDFKLDLSKNTCPTREDRANGINVFFGKASELLEEGKKGSLKCTDRDFQQSGGCLLNFYLSVRVASIRDAAVIFNGPVGCSTTALGYNEYFRLVPQELGRPEDFELHWLTTNLSEDDVVFGAKDTLAEAIREAQERYNPKAIFILTTCVTGIIGEDIEGTVNELQPEIDATIVPIHCEAVRSRIIQTGYDAFWHAVLKYLVKEPEKKQEDLVNIASMLSYTWQDRLEVIRLLGELGLRANFIPEFCTVEELEQLGEAAVTAPICPTFTDYLSKGLEQEFGVPYFLYPSPVGITNTDAWLRQIAKFTGKEKECEELIAREHKKWVPKLKELQKGFQDLSVKDGKLNVLGSLGQGRLVTQLPYFDELGIKATSAMAQDFDNLLLNELQDVIDTVGDFDIMVNTFQSAEQVHITKHTNPDVALTCPLQGGAWKLKTSSIARLHAVRGDPTVASAQCGYSGSIAYGNLLLQTLKNKSFQRIMTEENGIVYQDWYLEQDDPLYFVEKGK